jgi:hypothetical protein
MPASPYSHLPTVVEYLHRAAPASVLYIGIGNAFNEDYNEYKIKQWESLSENRPSL